MLAGALRRGRGQHPSGTSPLEPKPVHVGDPRRRCCLQVSKNGVKRLSNMTALKTLFEDAISEYINFIRIKRRLTFSTPVAALEEDDCHSTPRRLDGVRPNKNARLCSSPFSFAVPPRHSASFLRTPTMKSMAPSGQTRTLGACRAFIRRGRISRAIATPTSACVLKVAPAPKSNTTSQAVSAEAMPQPRMSPDSATRAVYANLFGCPAQFASVADVLPDSQGPAGDGNMTPLTDGFHCGTPTTMFAASVYTEQPKPGQCAVESENNDMRQEDMQRGQNGVSDMAGFGSPAVAAQEEGLIAAVPASAPFKAFLQAVASQAQACDGAHALIHSPWAPALQQSAVMVNPFLQAHQPPAASPVLDGLVTTPSRLTPADTFEFCFGTQQCPRDVMPSNEDVLQHGSGRMAPKERDCSLCHSDGTFAFDAGVSLRSGTAVCSADLGLTNTCSLKPSSTHLSVGHPFGNASDSDMEDSVDQIYGSLSESEDDEDSCMQQQLQSSIMQFERLAADLDDRFEALSMLSPDNQVPLLSRSLGRRVSVHGAHADMLEPWGRAAVFGCNTTSSGKLSIAASLAGSTHSHGPGTAMLKLARSEARHGAHASALLDVLEDVKTPLTSGKRKDEVLSTIGAPLEMPSRHKCNRTPSASPVPFSLRLGACMLEPARRSTPGTMECPSGQNTEASSPETAGRASIRVSAVTLSLTSLFEEIHANPHDVCDI